MLYCLFVKDSFFDYVRGDLITNVDEIYDILLGDYRRFVTKVALPQTSKG